MGNSDQKINNFVCAIALILKDFSCQPLLYYSLISTLCLVCCSVLSVKISSNDLKTQVRKKRLLHCNMFDMTTLNTDSRELDVSLEKKKLLTQFKLECQRVLACERE